MYATKHNNVQSVHCTLLKKIQDSWIFFDKTFLGLGLGKLFPAR